MANQQKPKRRLKAPQTVREKAKESSAKPVKPKRFISFRKKLKAPFKKLASFLNKYKLFRIIAKILKFIGKIIVPSYIRSSWRELKYVTWPNRRESRRLTFAVLAFSVVLGALIATLDYGLSNLFKAILLGK